MRLSHHVRTGLVYGGSQSLFTPIETILYFSKRLQIFLGIGHPISENQCSHHNFQKDCVQSFPTRETCAVFGTSLPVGTTTSADFSDLSTRDYGDLPTAGPDFYRGNDIFPAYRPAGFPRFLLDTSDQTVPGISVQMMPLYSADIEFISVRFVPL